MSCGQTARQSALSSIEGKGGTRFLDHVDVVEAIKRQANFGVRGG